MIDRRGMLAASLLATAAGAARAQSPPPPSGGMDRIGATAPLPPPPGVAGLQLRHAFSLTIFFRERVRIRSDAGRVFVPVIGGEVWGPRLSGRILPYGGADYAGGRGLDASYMIEAADGALIYINNRGFMKRLDGSPPDRQPIRPRAPGEVPSQDFVAPPDSEVPLRMRLAPAFDAPTGPHGWLNSTLLVGHGGRYMNPDHTLFTYYEVL